MGKHTSRRRAKGTVAIVAGAAVAIGGGVVLVNGLNHDGSSADQPTSAIGTSSSGSASGSGSATPTTGSGKTSSKKGSKKTGKSSSTSSHSSHKATTIPNPKSNSKQVSIANPAGAACIPKNLVVNSVGIDERVVPMGTNAQGQIYPPPHTTMWYDRSTQPGQAGISVIAGHVTYDGPDNFYNLRNVPVGAIVTVTCSSDKVVRLRVTHKESVLKTKLTTDQRVWGGSATPIVTLVTCDINSRMVNGHHLNNYVVWTKPA